MRKDAALRGAAMLRSSTGAEPGYPEGAIGETLAEYFCFQRLRNVEVIAGAERIEVKPWARSA